MIPQRLLVLALVASVGACASSSPASCNVDYACARGQTCWASAGDDFGCVPAGSGALGDSCDPSQHAPACGDGLYCEVDQLLLSGSFCRAFCASDGSCPLYQTCTKRVTPSGAEVHLCEPCNEEYSCALGRTCGSSTGAGYTCVASGSEGLGADCDASTGAATTCGDGLICVASEAGSTKGKCVAWCGASARCPRGTSCSPAVDARGERRATCS